MVLDGINNSGLGKVWFAGRGIALEWPMKREMPSSAYTYPLEGAAGCPFPDRRNDRPELCCQIMTLPIMQMTCLRGEP